ncbi:MAG: MATE family efflux transporter [Clostridium sp.]|uniref:MATE family efflux transporter n=1 Tax=Clostridium sp. TaxID=1506 RepID=UPI003074AEB0
MSFENSQDSLGTESIIKLLIKFSIPAIIGMVVNMLYTIVDRMYIGNIPNVGGLAITGVGITMPVTQIITSFGMLVGIGTCASISIAFGQNKKKDAAKYLGNGFTCILIISLFIAIFGNIFAKQILMLFGASENTLPYALAYIRPLFIGTICNLFAFGLNNSIRSDGNPKFSMFTMVIGAAVNIILDPIFIFVFNLGIEGAAYATVISQFIAGCWVLYYFTLSKKSSIKLEFTNLKLDKIIMKNILLIGMSPFLMQVASSIVSIIANKSLMTYGGDLAIGAMAIITSVYSIFIMPIYGLNQGAQPILGYNYGAKNYSRVRKTYIYSLLASTLILVLSSIFIQLCPNLAVSMFNSDSKLTELTVSGMRIFLLSLPIIGIQMTSSTYYQAVGKANKAMLISLSRQVIFLIPTFLILPKFFGLNGVWYAGPIADILSIIISGIIIFIEMRNLKNMDLTTEFNSYTEDIVA